MSGATEELGTLGGFELLALLGTGGMGRVYLARQLRPAREVALKFVHPHLADDDMRARFAREADALGRLSHPNIVSVYAFGEEDGKLFMAMERVQGTTLRHLMDAEGPLSPERARALTRQLINALAHAHSRHVVHRDLKPGNILVTVVDGVETLKVVDFGLARLLDSHDRVTRTGRLVGSAPYMSPEQWDETPDVSGTVDIYATGIMLFEMLTGQLPFRAKSSAGYMRAHLTQEPLNPLTLRPELSQHPGLLGLLRRCLQRDLALRPTAAELRGELGGSEPHIQLSDLPTGSGWSDRDVETEDSESPWEPSPELANTALSPAIPADPTKPEELTEAPNIEPLLPTPRPGVAPPGDDSSKPPHQPLSRWPRLALALLVVAGGIAAGVATTGDAPPRAPVPQAMKLPAPTPLGAAPPAPTLAPLPEPPAPPATKAHREPASSSPPPSKTAPTPVTVEIIAAPKPAIILIEGREVGTTPQSITVTPDQSVAFELKRSGFETTLHHLNFTAAASAQGGKITIPMDRTKRRGPKAGSALTSKRKAPLKRQPKRLHIEAMPIE